MHAVTSQRLTNAQAALLEIANVDLTEEELVDLRRLLMRYFRERLEREVDEVQQQTGKTTAQLEKSFSNRTAALKAARRQEAR